MATKGNPTIPGERDDAAAATATADAGATGAAGAAAGTGPGVGAEAGAAAGAGKARKRPVAPKPGGRSPAPARNSWRSRLTRTLAGGIREPAQLLELLREAATRGLIDADALAMVEGSLSMGALQARDLMVPRSEMVCIRREDPLASILSAVVQSGHSRFPVLDGDRDDVVGILLAKDLLRAVQAGRGLQPGGDARRLAFDMREYLRPAVFVPESKRLNVLLKEFRGNRNHMAIVVDEYGGVAGLITIEDVIEQVIGEIDDEYDVEDDQDIRDEPNGRSLVRGATTIADFNAHFGTQLADDEFDTIAGLVMQQFGRVPRRGESVTLDEFAFQVLRMDRRRIETLRVTRA